MPAKTEPGAWLRIHDIDVVATAYRGVVAYVHDASSDTHYAIMGEKRSASGTYVTVKRAKQVKWPATVGTKVMVRRWVRDMVAEWVN